MGPSLNHLHNQQNLKQKHTQKKKFDNNFNTSANQLIKEICFKFQMISCLSFFFSFDCGLWCDIRELGTHVIFLDFFFFFQFSNLNSKHIKKTNNFFLR